MTDGSTKCAWVIHERKTVQTHIQCTITSAHVPRVLGSVKYLHNNNNHQFTRKKITDDPCIIRIGQRILQYGILYKKIGNRIYRTV